MTHPKDGEVRCYLCGGSGEGAEKKPCWLCDGTGYHKPSVAARKKASIEKPE